MFVIIKIFKSTKSETFQKKLAFFHTPTELLILIIIIFFLRENSKLLDESVSLHCQQFHQNNLKSGNYGSLIRVFCRRATETREMSDKY